ncbi:PREDICTED: uncharacterized protein LOC108446824 [Corvus brachyrhynchos]|uniref:uncharacterized protein LOC108446824 n=1 Tax=Corvus brachyrhynchos TaxID=85066 RepID=UPI0008166EDF|nr:PREDICTED: uncharacterized protein LOC108446824 [Corvus brachyrhynchos]
MELWGGKRSLLSLLCSRLSPFPSSLSRSCCSSPFPAPFPALDTLQPLRGSPRRAPIHPCSGVSSPLDSPNIPHPWLGTKLPRFPQRCQEKTASPIPSSPPFPPPALPKSRNGLRGDLQSHPIPTPTSSTGPGCSKPHPWTLPGIQGQLQLLWECCAREGHAPWTNPGGPSGSSGGSRSVGAAPVPFPAGCTCAGPVAVARSWCFQLEFHALGSIPGSGVGSGIYSQALESIPRVQSLSTGSGVPSQDLGSLPRVWGPFPGSGVHSQGLGSLPRIWGPFPGFGVHSQGLGSIPQDLGSLPRVWGPFPGFGVPSQGLGSIPQDLGSLPRVWGPFPRIWGLLPGSGVHSQDLGSIPTSPQPPELFIPWEEAARASDSIVPIALSCPCPSPSQDVSWPQVRIPFRIPLQIPFQIPLWILLQIPLIPTEHSQIPDPDPLALCPSRLLLTLFHRPQPWLDLSFPNSCLVGFLGKHFPILPRDGWE